MNNNFRFGPICLALLLAFPVASQPAFANEPFSALPPALSSSVKPNIMLYLDTSGSMLQDQTNNWMLTNLCDSNRNWANCVDNNTRDYRTKIDSPTISPNTKMNIAKGVASDLVKANPTLRFGLFTFDDKADSIGGAERAQGGVLRYPISDMSVGTNKNDLLAAISSIHGRTSTPLAEGLLDITRYFEGKPSLYKCVDDKRNSDGNCTSAYISYTSPIQYRCQKSFVILMTDGTAFEDQNLPGTGQKGGDGNIVVPPIKYTARDSSGGAVTETFSVCQAANAVVADGRVVNCPAKLDGTTINRDFGDNNNRPSAFRDVAMYANVADLRVGGEDLDKKSFDDPKFAKQSVSTYAVGISVNNDVLKAAAFVGGGISYNVTTKQDLAAALANAVNSINSVVSTAGGLATSSNVKQSGNKLFQPIFYSDGWYGRLLCFDMTTAGLLGNACTNSQASIPGDGAKTGTGSTDDSQATKNSATASRKIFSAKWQSGVFSPFDFNASGDTTGATALGSMTATQQTLLGSDATAQKNTILFLRGIEGITGFRSRLFVDPESKVTNKILLGDILDGQPLVVSKPMGTTSDTAYAQFKIDNDGRNMVFIGANDGMLHAFGISDMKELMGYIPSSVYPHLKALTATDYGASAGTLHTYHVNGQLRQQDIKVGTAWQTLLVGGLAQGGQGYFAIDATSATNTVSKSASAAVKWEFNDQHDSEMGYTFGVPLIYNVRIASDKVVPAVIFANGYENSYDDTAVGGKKVDANSSALYIVKASDGTLLKKIQVAGKGLSSPAGVDFGQDGVLDYVYAGDINGNLWRFDLTANKPDDFKVIGNPIFSAGAEHPITVRPAVKAAFDKDGKSIGNLVLFGTGKLLIDTDRSDKTVQSFYAVLDDMSDTGTTVAKTKLFPRTVLDTVEVIGSGTGTDAIRGGSYRKLSSDSFDLRSDSATYSGWYLDLPTETERVTTSPVMLDNLVLFGTGIPKATDVCVAGGTGWVMGVDLMTGTIPKSNAKEYSFVDIKLDGESTKEDKVNFSTGASYVSGFSKDGIPTELTVVANSMTMVKGTGAGGALGDAGNVLALTDSNSMGVYIGNSGATPPSTGNQADWQVPGGGGVGGVICSGGKGNSGVGCDTSPVLKSGAYKVETTIWREIK